MRKAVVEIDFDTERDLDIIFRSIEPEVKKKIPKTEISLQRKDRKMILSMESQDTSSLRAVCNSFLRWIETARSIRDVMLGNTEDD